MARFLQGKIYGTIVVYASYIPSEVGTRLAWGKLWHDSCYIKNDASCIGIRFAGGARSADGVKKLLQVRDYIYPILK